MVDSWLCKLRHILNSQCSVVLLVKMGIITVPTSEGCYEEKHETVYIMP